MPNYHNYRRHRGKDLAKIACVTPLYKVAFKAGEQPLLVDARLLVSNNTHAGFHL